MDRSADWLDQAQGDLAHAVHDFEGAFYDWACFSAQQAGEKAAKAVLRRLGVEAAGHSIADLLDEVARSAPVPDAVRDAALELDKAYSPTRYPDAHPSRAPRRRYIRAEAERLIAQARAVVEFFEGLLAR